MMYSDGIPLSLLSDDVLLKEYNSIRMESWDEYYNDKGQYLFFRQREIMYELHSRGIETPPPNSFVGFNKKKFNHYTPPLGRTVRVLHEVVEGFKEGEMYVKKPMGRAEYLGFLAQQNIVRSIVQYGMDTEHGIKTSLTLKGIGMMD